MGEELGQVFKPEIELISLDPLFWIQIGFPEALLPSPQIPTHRNRINIPVIHVTFIIRPDF